MNDMQSNKVYDIALGCDQNGLELKNEVAIYLTDLGYKVKRSGRTCWGGYRLSGNCIHSLPGYPEK